MNRPARRLALGALCLALAVPLRAQQPRAPRVGYVRGVVYDSLRRAPLDSARVFVDGTSISAITDEGGRFRLDSVPAGRRVIMVEHPDLDSTGIGTIARRVDVPANRIVVVDLATPSLATMEHAACPAGLGASVRDSGIVYGTVTDAESGARLRRARVRVAWIRAGRGPDGRVEVTRPGLDAVTDSVGNYYFCGVPTEYVVTVAGTAGAFSSGVTELLLGRRSVARRDLAIPRDSASLPDSAGVRRGNATIIGTVRDEHDNPRPSARVSVDDAAGETFSDQEGRFLLGGLPSGSQMLMVRMVGFSAVHQPVRLRSHDTLHVTVHLRQITVLDTLRITASSQRAENDLGDLQERMRLGLGYFLSSEEVKHRQSMRAVFQGLPSLTVEGPSVFQYRLQTLVNGNPCLTTVYVDGVLTDTEAIQSYRPDQLIAVEWYPRGQQAPIKYQPAGGNQECSVMLVWTRFIR